MSQVSQPKPEKLTCVQDGDECSGAVAMRDVGRPDGKCFPRCEKHFRKRLQTEQGIRARYPQHAPSDFDTMDAGEAWGEEDY